MLEGCLVLAKIAGKTLRKSEIWNSSIRKFSHPTRLRSFKNYIFTLDIFDQNPLRVGFSRWFCENHWQDSVIRMGAIDIFTTFLPDRIKKIKDCKFKVAGEVEGWTYSILLMTHVRLSSTSSMHMIKRSNQRCWAPRVFDLLFSPTEFLPVGSICNPNCGVCLYQATTTRCKMTREMVWRFHIPYRVESKEIQSSSHRVIP